MSKLFRLAILLLIFSCAEDSGEELAPISIISVSPECGVEGDRIRIEGENIVRSISVTIEGIEVERLSFGDDFLSFNIPVGIAPGVVEISFIANGEEQALYDNFILRSKGSWERRNSTFPGVDRDNAISFVLADKLYYGGGNTDPDSQLVDFWEYDITNDVWSQLNDIGFEFFPVSSISFDGKGFVSSIDRDLYEYDPSLDSWEVISSVPVRGGNFQADLLVFDDRLFFEFGNEMWEFDMGLNDWEFFGNTPGGLEVFVIEDVLYGRNALSSYRYDDVADEWLEFEQLMVILGEIQVGIISNNVNAYYGFVKPIGENIGSTFYEYLPSCQRWVEKTDFPEAGRERSVFFPFEDKLYLGLGSGSKDMWVFEPDQP